MDKEIDIAYACNLYLQEHFSFRQIASRLGTSPKTIQRKLIAEGVTIRHKNHASKDKNSRWQNKNYLSSLYLSKGLSTIKIASELRVSPGTVSRWLKRFEIPRREKGGSLKGQTMSLASREKMRKSKKGKYLGANNPNWKGAKISAEIRDRRSYQAKIWRAACLNRDGHTCTACGSIEKLHVHHILAYKEYPDRRWDLHNGKTLCVFCHEKVHKRTFPNWVTEREITLHKNPEPILPQKQPRFEIDRATLIWLYESNGAGSIARMFGFNAAGTVLKKLRSMSIPIRKASYFRTPIRKPKSIPSRLELLEVYPSMNLIDAGKHFGVGQTTMHKWLKARDIERTKKNR